MTDDELLSVPDNIQKDFRWTTKRREFCYHMARFGNVGEASDAAGIKKSTGQQLFALEPVRRTVQQEIERMLRVSAETEETVIARWSRWADVDIGDYFEENWQLKQLDQLTEDNRRCIKKLKITHNAHGRNIDLEFHDAHRANNDLATMMGLLGKGDVDTTPPEETANRIQQLLQQMAVVDGLEPSEITDEEASEPRTIN